MQAWAHFKTITKHRWLVRRYCFRLGLYWQGLTHDLSKYSPIEFWRGAKYYQGYRSPNDAERRDLGVSMAWLHHQGRNRHHIEYWLDYAPDTDGVVRYCGRPMPMRYIAEMFCDRMAASRTYLKDEFTYASPYEYFQRTHKHMMMHPDTAAEIGEMLRVLKDEGPDAAFAYVRGRLDSDRAARKQRK